MIKQYALFSHANRKSHFVLVSLTLGVFMFSAVKLLIGADLTYLLGLMVTPFFLFLFAKSSEYKRKYIGKG